MTADPLIVGAGPTGLAASLFLAERGIRSRIIDQAPAPSVTSRAQVVNPRTLELLESSGVSAAMVAEARPIYRVVFYENWETLAELEFGDAHPRYHLSVLPQARSESLLTEALAARGLRPERGVGLVAFSQNEMKVEAVLADASGRRQAPVLPEAVTFCCRRYPRPPERTLWVCQMVTEPGTGGRVPRSCARSPSRWKARRFAAAS